MTQTNFPGVFVATPALTESTREFVNDEMNYWDDRFGFGDGWRSPLPVLVPQIPDFGGKGNFAFGKDRYHFTTEMDLQLTRDAGRVLGACDPIAIGLISDMGSFTVGSGFSPKVTAPPNFDKESAKKLSTLVRNYLESWKKGTIWAELERESYEQSLKDGDIFVRGFFNEASRELTTRRIPAELITDPTKGGERSQYSWGILHAGNDTVSAIEYNVSDVCGTRGEAVPAERMGQYKRNVPLATKRGVPDFFPLVDKAEGIGSLSKAIQVGAIARSKIAYIQSLLQGGQGATDDIKTKIEANSKRVPGRLFGNTSQISNMHHGSVPILAGVDIKTMPQGTTLEAIAAVQLALRIFGRRWSLPEFMISADASNNNYASILVAGTPFTRKIIDEQTSYGRFISKVYRMAITAAVRFGHLPWEALQCVIEAVGPSPYMTNRREEEELRGTRIRNKTMSPQQAIVETGSDIEETIREIQEWQEIFPDAASQLPLGGGFDTI